MGAFVIRNKGIDGDVEKKKYHAVSNRITGYIHMENLFPYLTYTGENLSDVEQFCSPLEVLKTKKFHSSKKITVCFPTGSQSITINDQIIRFSEKYYLVIPKEDFDELFTVEVRD